MIIMVTGATAGFGESITRRFIANGHKVIATGRREERLKTLKDELGDNLYIAQLDVRNRAAIETLIADLPAEWQAIDVLVNNAGLALGLEPAHRASVEDWEDMIDTNNKGLVYMTRAVLPGMVERNRGHIINIGSTAGSWPYAGGNVYGATKAFVRQFSLNLRTDLHGTAVRVTDIEPGQILTGTVVRIMNFGAFVELAPNKDGMVHISKLSDKRVAKVEDVVNIGDEVTVKVIEVDKMGRINLSMKPGDLAENK